MKQLLIAFGAILAVVSARPNEPVTIEVFNHNLLGSKVCTQGPGYWCQNLTTSAGCHATKHCIERHWNDLEVPEDTDSVCTICKNMVTQARDQLESNQTQQDLKLVFEGSCALIHIKPIVHECDKLVDDFVPELVETLASQMNPSVVCSVAGLCNSAHIDKLLEDYGNENTESQPMVMLKNDEYAPNECTKCYTIVTHMQLKSKNASQNEFLKRLLNFCGQMGSFSDGCSSIVLTYFDVIRERFEQEFTPDNVCHLSGKCAQKFHFHEGDEKALNVEIRPLSSVGMVEVSDDLPCKLCEQLVSHLRDLLVANTTESEFQMILEGMCKQTKSFASECTSIVDQYYPQIYKYLTDELNSNFVCEMGGICPTKNLNDGPIMPLIPHDALRVGLRIMDEERPGETENDREASDMQLPIERMYPSLLAGPQWDVQGQKTCAFCEYLLHYIQEVITNPATEDEVKTIVEKVCKKLPNAVEGNCEQFIDVYGNALVAILANQIDPSTVCPRMGVCPSAEVMELVEKIPKEYTLESEVKDKPTCPLCLLAVQDLYETIKNDKTEANIQKQLDKLCAHLPKSLDSQCTDFVKNYSKELIEKLIDDMTPAEVCASIKLCDKQREVEPPSLFLTDKDGEIMTNEIPDYVPEKPSKDVESVGIDVECTVCKEIMKWMETKLSNNNTKNKIEEVIHDVCHYIPKSMAVKCNHFVDQYADLIIELLSHEVTPRELCKMMEMCSDVSFEEKMKKSLQECALCRQVSSEVDKFLNSTKTVHDLEENFAEVCTDVKPASLYNKCHSMMMIYGQSMINIIKEDGAVDRICSEIALCSGSDSLIKIIKERIRQE